MSTITEKLNSFYEISKNCSLLVSKQDTIKLLNKTFVFSGIGIKSKEIKTLINLDDIIFSIDDRIILTKDKFLILEAIVGNPTKLGVYNLDEFLNLNGSPKGVISWGYIELRGIKICEYNSFKDNLFILFSQIKKVITKQFEEDEKRKSEHFMENERQRLAIELEAKNILISKKSSVLSSLDQNNDGIVDIVENPFNKLFAKNQKCIIEIDKNYIHKFVKVSNYIKTKQQNTQKIFESIRDTSTQEELEERVSLLKNQIHAYELLVFHSINMIGSLVSEDLITFYEIYESFDKISMFNSNWENEVSEKLTNIGDKLDDLMYSIYNMEQNIVTELRHLSYVTQESFEDLNKSVTSQLKEVESSINTNNLLTGIQAYQLYKINKNTKGFNN